MRYHRMAACTYKGRQALVVIQKASEIHGLEKIIHVKVTEWRRTDGSEGCVPASSSFFYPIIFERKSRSGR